MYNMARKYFVQLTWGIVDSADGFGRDLLYATYSGISGTWNGCSCSSLYPFSILFFSSTGQHCVTLSQGTLCQAWLTPSVFIQCNSVVVQLLLPCIGLLLCQGNNVLYLPQKLQPPHSCAHKQLIASCDSTVTNLQTNMPAEPDTGNAACVACAAGSLNQRTVVSQSKTCRHSWSSAQSAKLPAAQLKPCSSIAYFESMGALYATLVVPAAEQ